MRRYETCLELAPNETNGNMHLLMNLSLDEISNVEFVCNEVVYLWVETVQ